MKNTGGLKCILAIIGGIVVIAAAAAAVIHFWEDIKKYLPCSCKCGDACEDCETFEEFEDFADSEA
ncbi:MAG: hypothetical protein LBM28_00990 [Oscillospiraceae bacterium]|jgi:hypothetical protein|nr:hypothetical protein [Oscillospiraceae bacterium]